MCSAVSDDNLLKSACQKAAEFPMVAAMDIVWQVLVISAKLLNALFNQGKNITVTPSPLARC